ncbi:MAG: hypothetical protein NTZ35_02665 [Ignavibacteriales bacterium]|nr:hypothetical protein [Ignavibacteriales bacterium]
MQNRTVVRYVLIGVGVVLALMFLSGGSGSVWFLVLGLIALFLGITDFGRQCPLILSVRHLAYRLRSKGKPPILSAKPIEEINKADRDDMPS